MILQGEVDATVSRAFCCSLMRIKGPIECNARVALVKEAMVLVKKKRRPEWQT